MGDEQAHVDEEKRAEQEKHINWFDIHGEDDDGSGGGLHTNRNVFVSDYACLIDSN